VFAQQNGFCVANGRIGKKEKQQLWDETFILFAEMNWP
jgi:hypothetical protein